MIVETKRSRVLRRPGDPEPQVENTPVAQPVAEPEVQKAAAPAPQPVAPAPAPRAQPAAPARAMTPLERREQQERLLREAEEARMAANEENRRREERLKVEATEDEKRRAEENKRAEEDARKRAEEEAKNPSKAAPVEQPVEAAPAAEPEVAQAAAEPEARADGAPPPRRFTPVASPPRRPEPPKRTAAGRPGTDDRRQSGKLTVTKALDDEGGARARSLAALKRSREKDKRHHQSGGPQAKQVRDVVVPEAITVAELANRMAERDRRFGEVAVQDGDARHAPIR